MSWILTRKKGDAFQMYRDADIYGRGKWEGNDCPWWHFPERYRRFDEAESIIKREQEKDPEWDYRVSYYE
jgi:hypothetical protein